MHKEEVGSNLSRINRHLVGKIRKHLVGRISKVGSISNRLVSKMPGLEASSKIHMVTLAMEGMEHRMEDRDMEIETLLAEEGVEEMQGEGE